MDAVGKSPLLDVTPPPESVAPIPPGSNLPVVTKKPMPPKIRLILRASATVLVLLFVAWFLLDRRSIAKDWPILEGLYDSIGLHIYHTGEGLSFIKVRSELRYDSGLTMLYVEGKIHNGTPNVQEIPDIMATAIGSDGSPMQSWQIPAPAIKVFGDENMPFHSSINAPKGTVSDINLSFIEKKDASE
jgi:hypothetical protein